jgi:ParB/RepB/Spo0J family partition protein
MPAMTYEKGKLYDLSMTRVQPDPDQPRKYFDEQALAELSASITSHGVLQPILVRTGAEGSFIIVSGERCYQAAQNAGLESIPAIITDGEPTEISNIENLLRENLTAIEEAEAIEKLRALTLELRKLYPPGGAFKFRTNPVPAVEKNGSFYWILSAGDYELLGNPR